MIELIVLDVDGTLTNGQISYTASGDEIKSFCVKDGMAIASWTKKFNKKAAIITGRKSTIVEKRAKELGITHLYQGVDNKDEILENILQKENLTWENIASIGDDLNDYKMLKKSKLSFSPANGVDEIKQIVDITTLQNGGNGAVRFMIEYILEFNKMDSLETLWV